MSINITLNFCEISPLLLLVASWIVLLALRRTLLR